MFRCVGVAQFFLGYFYMQGGRGNSIHVIATTMTFDFILYPIAMLLMYAIGLRGSLCLFKGVGEPFWGLCMLACLYLVKDQGFRGNEILVGGVWLTGESRRAEFGKLGEILVRFPLSS